MSIANNLHPLWKGALRGYNKPTGEVNDALINALQYEVDRAEASMYSTKIDSYLDTARGVWLDYWGSWLGLQRLSGENDYTYREKLKHHVLHSRSTNNSIRQALADYLHTNVGNIYIYEPYRDMFIWNSSKWNTYKFYPSTYYRYAVIDVQIDSPINTIAGEIINLFRPAGVIWVITSLVNVLNTKAPIIDFTAYDKYNFVTEDVDYIGFTERDANYILPNFDRTIHVTDPFIYNDSLLNGGKKYYTPGGFHNMIWLGKVLKDYEPTQTLDTGQSKSFVEMLPLQDYNAMSRIDDLSKDFDYNSLGIGGGIDFYTFLGGNLTGNTPKQAVLNKLDKFPIKTLATYMKVKGIGSKQTIHPYVYDFINNMWVKFSDYELSSKYKLYRISFNTLKPYLNNNGIMYVKFMFDTQSSISVDYFGFDYEDDSVGVMRMGSTDGQFKMGAYTQDRYND